MNDTPPPLQPQDPNATIQYQPGPPSGSGKKWGVGCGIGCLVIVVIGVILTVVGVIAGKNWLQGMASDFTAETPVEIVQPALAPEVVDDAISRYDGFTTALDEGSLTEPLVLSADDINALISNHPAFEAVADSMVVKIEDNKLSGKVSLDLDSLDLPESFLTEVIAGKFFNGEVTLRMSEPGELPALYIEDLAVGGQPVPSMWLEGLRQENLLGDAQRDPEARRFFDQIGELSIQDNQLRILPKSAP